MVRTVATIRVKEMECAGGCGKAIRVGSNTRNKPQCIDCSIRHMQENNTQLAQKSGPYYDKWLARMAGFIASKHRGAPPSA